MKSRHDATSSVLWQTPFYYGWVIVVFGTLSILMSIPGQTMGVSPMTETLIKSLGISRTSLSMCYLWGTLGSSLLLPKAGVLLDRIGVQRMILMSSWSLAFFLLTMTMIVSLDIASTLPKSLVLVLTTIFFLGIRQTGQGQLTLIGRTVIGRWFEAKRGLAFAISGVFVSLGFGGAPAFLHMLQEQLNFEGMLIVLAIFLLCLGSIASLALRDSPESCNLERIDQSTKHSQNLRSHSKSLKEAQRTAVFWAILSGITAQALLITAVTFHIEAIAVEQKISSSNAFQIFVPIALLSTLSNLVGSWLSDKVSIRWHLMILNIALGVGLIGVARMLSPLGYGLAIMGLGVSGGLFACLTGVAWPKLFGIENLGEINGFSTACMVFGSALGPYLFSLLRTEKLGFSSILNYAAVFPWVLALCTMLVAFPSQEVGE